MQKRDRQEEFRNLNLSVFGFDAKLIKFASKIRDSNGKKEI